jgi:hypothetical protein
VTGTLGIVACLLLVVAAMVAVDRAGLGYQWRVWAVLAPPVILVLLGIRLGVRRMRKAQP